MCVLVCQQVKEQDAGKEEEESLRAKDTATVVRLRGRVVGVSMTKPSISIGALCLISI